MKIDATDIEIIKHLREGRKPYRKIADALGMAENTVKARVRKLEENGALEIAGLIDPEIIPGHSLIIVGVKLGTMDLVKKGEEFRKLRGVVSVCVVTGQYDLILVVLLREGFGLLEFYTEEVARITDVHSTETWVVYKNYNLKVPYIV